MFKETQKFRIESSKRGTALYEVLSGIRNKSGSLEMWVVEKSFSSTVTC